MKTATAIAAILFATGFAACTPAAEETTPAETAEAAAPTIAPFAASADASPFAIGDLQAVALRDAGFGAPNDNKTLAINKTKADVDAVLTAAGLPTDALQLSVQPLLVRTSDQLFLFDTGVGAGGGGTLAASMSAAGAAPADVTNIFISHMHFDHVGGLVADGALAFPNAAIHMSTPEWVALRADANQAALVAVIEPKIATFEPGTELVPGVLSAADIKGHTPGHSGYVISSGDASLLYIGDTMHHYVVSVQQPDWTIAFDGDAPVAQESRKQVLASAADSGQRVYAVHFPFPGLGKFARQGDGFVWAAE